MKAILYIKDRMGLKMLGRVNAPMGTETLYTRPEHPDDDYPIMQVHLVPGVPLDVAFERKAYDQVNQEHHFVYEATHSNSL